MSEIVCVGEPGTLYTRNPQHRELTWAQYKEWQELRREEREAYMAQFPLVSSAKGGRDARQEELDRAIDEERSAPGYDRDLSTVTRFGEDD